MTPSFADRASLERHQLKVLNAMLALLRDANPFYSRRLARAGVDGDAGGIAEFVERVPVTTKQQLVDNQLEHPPYGTNLSYPLERYTRLYQTSGTTSTPMRWLDTPESWRWMLDVWERVFRVSGVTARDHILFAFSFGPFLGFWLAYESAQRLGSLLLPSGGMRSVARLRMMIANRATVLCCTPTYALRLAEIAAEEGIDLKDASVERILVAGEPGGSIAATRARIEDLWNGARVVDHHGMTEIGPVSYECPKRPGVLHVVESAYIAEVIDPETGLATTPGETGELVLTNLGRWGSPILRYRTRDLVRRGSGETCECGSCDLTLEGGILGRTDDLVVVRGVNIHPSTVEELMRGFSEVAEYRVEVRTDRTLPELRIQVELTAHTDDAAGLVKRLRDVLSSGLGLRVSVGSVPIGTLPRFEMKSQRWVRE